jgi:hypothetical protein
MMTRKHFIRIAFILKENKASQKMIEEFAAYFYEQNDNFDYHRFLNACTDLEGK